MVLTVGYDTAAGGAGGSTSLPLPLPLQRVSKVLTSATRAVQQLALLQHHASGSALASALAGGGGGAGGAAVGVRAGSGTSVEQLTCEASAAAAAALHHALTFLTEAAGDEAERGTGAAAMLLRLSSNDGGNATYGAGGGRATPSAPLWRLTKAHLVVASIAPSPSLRRAAALHLPLLLAAVAAATTNPDPRQQPPPSAAAAISASAGLRREAWDKPVDAAVLAGAADPDFTAELLRVATLASAASAPNTADAAPQASSDPADVVVLTQADVAQATVSRQLASRGPDPTKQWSPNEAMAAADRLAVTLPLLASRLAAVHAVLAKALYTRPGEPSDEEMRVANLLLQQSVRGRRKAAGDKRKKDAVAGVVIASQLTALSLEAAQAAADDGDTGTALVAALFASAARDVMVGQISSAVDEVRAEAALDAEYAGIVADPSHIEPRDICGVSLVPHADATRATLAAVSRLADFAATWYHALIDATRLSAAVIASPATMPVACAASLRLAAGPVVQLGLDAWRMMLALRSVLRRLRLREDTIGSIVGAGIVRPLHAGLSLVHGAASVVHLGIDNTQDYMALPFEYAHKWAAVLRYLHIDTPAGRKQHDLEQRAQKLQDDAESAVAAHDAYAEQAVATAADAAEGRGGSGGSGSGTGGGGGGGNGGDGDGDAPPAIAPQSAAASLLGMLDTRTMRGDGTAGEVARIGASIKASDITIDPSASFGAGAGGGALPTVASTPFDVGPVSGAGGGRTDTSAPVSAGPMPPPLAPGMTPTPVSRPATVTSESTVSVTFDMPVPREKIREMAQRMDLLDERSKQQHVDYRRGARAAGEELLDLSAMMAGAAKDVRWTYDLFAESPEPVRFVSDVVKAFLARYNTLAREAAARALAAANAAPTAGAAPATVSPAAFVVPELPSTTSTAARAMPSPSDIEVVLLLDNSGSMTPYTIHMQEAVMLSCEVLRQLELRFAVARFGGSDDGCQVVLKGLDEPFSTSKGQQVLESLTFDEGSFALTGVDAIARKVWGAPVASGGAGAGAGAGAAP